MAKTVFLCTLGTNPYSDIRYLPLPGEPETDATPYIQEARLSALLKQDIKPDKVLVYVTEGERGSRASNWTHRTVKVMERGAPVRFDKHSDGLEQRLRAMGITEPPISIPTGHSEDELWEIFETLSRSVDTGDTLYVDITHGFRTLPVILLVALEYLQRAKDVRVEQVSYGAYEASPDGYQTAPTFDLTPFLVLQEWTAALALLDSGDFRAIGKRIEVAANGLQRLLHADMPRALRSLPARLQALGDCLWVNRLLDLPKAARAADSGLKESRRALELLRANRTPELQSAIRALSPITAVLDKLAQQVAVLMPKTGESELMFGLLAAQFCIEHGLMAQGLTLARETHLSMLLRLAQVEDIDGVPRHHLDAFVGACDSSTHSPDPRKVPEQAQQAFSELHLPPYRTLGGEETYKAVCSTVRAIAGRRNVVNHAGTDPTRKLPSTESLRATVLPRIEESKAWVRLFFPAPATA